MCLWNSGPGSRSLSSLSRMSVKRIWLMRQQRPVVPRQLAACDATWGKWREIKTGMRWPTSTVTLKAHGSQMILQNRPRTFHWAYWLPQDKCTTPGFQTNLRSSNMQFDEKHTSGMTRPLVDSTLSTTSSNWGLCICVLSKTAEAFSIPVPAKSLDRCLLGISRWRGF